MGGGRGDETREGTRSSRVWGYDTCASPRETEASSRESSPGTIRFTYTDSPGNTDRSPGRASRSARGASRRARLLWTTLYTVFATRYVSHATNLRSRPRAAARSRPPRASFCVDRSSSFPSREVRGARGSRLLRTPLQRGVQPSLLYERADARISVVTSADADAADEDVGDGTSAGDAGGAGAKPAPPGSGSTRRR